MHVSLTPELEEAVKSKVASGLYNNASDGMKSALREGLPEGFDDEMLARALAWELNDAFRGGWSVVPSGTPPEVSRSLHPGGFTWNRLMTDEEVRLRVELLTKAYPEEFRSRGWLLESWWGSASPIWVLRKSHWLPESRSRRPYSPSTGSRWTSCWVRRCVPRAR